LKLRPLIGLWQPSMILSAIVSSAIRRVRDINLFCILIGVWLSCWRWPLGGIDRAFQSWDSLGVGRASFDLGSTRLLWLCRDIGAALAGQQHYPVP